MLKKLFKLGSNKKEEPSSVQFVRLIESGHTGEMIRLGIVAQRYAVKHGLEVPDGDLLEMDANKWAENLYACIVHSQENPEGEISKEMFQSFARFLQETQGSFIDPGTGSVMKETK